MTDEDYMRKAIELAVKATGFTNPNPLVGAVIVKNGKIIGQGYHQRYGELHAERNAISDCSESAEGATIYVTLEPCCHYGKTPPCTEAIIENKIARVVIGSSDPNPLAAGKGVDILRSHGIDVVEGVLQEECDAINEVFFHYIKYKTPFVVMKYAMTMDGKIATHTGASKWITGEMARENVHRLRQKFSAIMVGVNTVIVDNPMLNVRLKELENPANPIRIVCDTNLRTPIESNVVMTANQISTIIATSSTDTSRIEQYRDKGCEIVAVNIRDGHINLNELMVKLGQLNIDSILLEGGSSLNYSALQSHIVHKVQTYISPKIFGGINAKTPVGGAGVNVPAEAFGLINSKVSMVGEDILIESDVRM